MPILHRTRTLSALIPRYVSRFSCIGPQCEDNCCTGWKVDIDKKTYKAYRQSDHPALAERFARDMVRASAAPTGKLEYGSIALKPGTQECPMMEERLCAVQKHLDESHLSHTCFSYPRTTRTFAGQAEQALVLSCPEAARQALLAPDAFEFVESDITVRLDVVGRVVTKHGIDLEAMNDVRIFCLNLLRAPELALWQRLAVLGVFCERLSGALAGDAHATVGALLDEFVAVLEQGQLLVALADMQPNLPAQALVFSTLWGGKSFDTRSAVQNQVLGAIAAGLGADQSGQVSSDQLIERYTLGVQRLPEALQAAPQLLEHYLLNEMFSNVFPFECTDPYDSYLQLVSRFGLVRLMLAAQCAGDAPLPDAAALARTVQVFCRRFQHDSGFAGRVNQALHDSGWATLDKLYGFLRS
jgi:lysine-N-methylase